METSQGGAGAEAQSDAQQLMSQIADMQSELAVVYQGGNSMTDHGLALAKNNLDGAWSERVLRDTTNLARKNLLIRQNSIMQAAPVGMSEQGRQQYGFSGGGGDTTPAGGGGGGTTGGQTNPADPLNILK